MPSRIKIASVAGGLMGMLLLLGHPTSAADPAFPQYEGLDTNTYLTVIPTPRRELYHNRFWRIGSVAMHAPADEALREIAAPFAAYCEDELGLARPDKPRDDGAGEEAARLMVRLSAGSDRANGLPAHPRPDHPEGYVLLVQREGDAVVAHVAGNTVKGAQHGLQSLRQLLMEWRGDVIVRSAEIEDWPAIPYRLVKRTGWWLDQAVRYKMNGGTTPIWHNNIKRPDRFPEWARKQAEQASQRGLYLLGMVEMGYIAHGAPEAVERNVELFRVAYEQGYTHLAMMNDDKPTLADPAARQRFGDYYTTQMHYAQRILAGLREAGYEQRLGFMPNHYYGQGVARAWLDAIGGSLPSGLALFWAGTNTPGETLTVDHLRHVKQQVGPEHLWFYTNWPQAARPQGMRAWNPPRQRAFGEGDLVELVTVSVDTRRRRFPTSFISMADRLWNPAAFDPDRSLRRATKEVVGPESFDAFYDLFRYQDAVAPIPSPGTKNVMLAASDFATRRELIEARSGRLDALIAACLQTPAGQTEAAREAIEKFAGQKQRYLDRLAKTQQILAEGRDHRQLACPQVDTAPTLDGTIDESVWQQAAMATDFTDLRGDKPAPQDTTVRVMRKGDRLFFGITCDEPAMDDPVFDQGGFDYPVSIDERSGEFVWWSESVELFFDPEGDQQDVYQLILNVWGMKQAIRYDLAAPDAWGQMDHAPEPPPLAVTGKVALHEGHWTLEFSVPIEDLGVSDASGAWRFNMARNRRIRPREHPGIKFTTWTPLSWGFGDAYNFGELAFE